MPVRHRRLARCSCSVARPGSLTAPLQVTTGSRTRARPTRLCRCARVPSCSATRRCCRRAGSATSPTSCSTGAASGRPPPPPAPCVHSHCRSLARVRRPSPTGVLYGLVGTIVRRGVTIPFAPFEFRVVAGAPVRMEFTSGQLAQTCAPAPAAAAAAAITAIPMPPPRRCGSDDKTRVCAGAALRATSRSRRRSACARSTVSATLPWRRTVQRCARPPAAELSHVLPCLTACAPVGRRPIAGLDHH